MTIARNVTATGEDATEVAAELVAGLHSEALRFVAVFADWRLDPATLARELQRALAPAPVVGCTAIGVIGGRGSPGAVALGLYGDWVRAGVGVAPQLSSSALAHSRDAIHQAAAALGTTAAALDPARHVALTLVDGCCGHEEAFCIGSAAAAPQIRVVGGSASTDVVPGRRTFVWALGEALADAGVAVVLDSSLPFEAVTSSHVIATPIKTVVTAANGRVIEELDGWPAVNRLRELVNQLGNQLDETWPSEYSFARFVDGVPYVRSMTGLVGAHIQLASAVESGHVLRLMRSGDLIAVTRNDLEAVAGRVGGSIGALFAFSCMARHCDAAARGLEAELAEVYAAYPTTGFQSFGEQTGMLLVNHTLTGLAFGAARVPTGDR